MTLSPELDSPYEVAFRSLASLAEWAGERDDRQRNEATTRLQLIDKLLEDCLAWPSDHITAEVPQSGEYVDYELGKPATRVVVEAKREGIAFELPPGFDRRTIDLPRLYEMAPGVGEAVDQAIGYCVRRGVGIGVVANGRQLVAFLGSRQDGVSPNRGRAIVYGSLEEMLDSFSDFWRYLSRPGIESQALYSLLQRGTQPPPPDKLSSRIGIYPGVKRRNQLQAELKILGDLFLEDLANDPALEQQFLEEAYCTTGELSQYALISKDILQTRYNAFFSETEGVDEHPVATRSGLSPTFSSDVIAASLSRRPIILLGDVGVGKTTFIRRVMRVEARELFEHSVSLHVNFGTEPALTNEIEAYVRRNFIAQLLDLYGIDIYEDGFVRSVYRRELERFGRGIYGPLRDSEPEEFARQERALLERHLATTDAHLKASLGHISRVDHRQVVIFLDNVDQRPFRFQEQAFLIAQSFAASWPATVFVSLRPETFYRSRSTGSLAAYQPRVFTIAPPRIDQVLERRLEFAHNQLTNQRTLAVLGSEVSFQSATLDAYVAALRHSLRANRDLTELLDNLSGGNVRQAIRFLTEFVGSGHVDSDKIVEIVERTGRYTVPVHEFLRALIFGDHEYYDPSRSPIANVFDISTADRREHFMLCSLIEFVDRAGDAPGAAGFVPAEDIFAEGQRLGFAPAQITAALDTALEKRLLEPNLRGLLYGDADRYRITTIGAYTATRLPRMFTYVDAMIVDTPITDRDVQRQIRDVRSIDDRLARAELLRRYLDASWEPIADAASFDWKEASADLAGDIEQIARRVGLTLDEP